MRILKIKVTFPYNFPIQRQFPNNKFIWGNNCFYINKDIEKCDYWVVIDNLLNTEKVICSVKNTLLITGEPPLLKKYNKSFVKQFGAILTCHRMINHPNIIISQQGLPWMAGAKYIKEKNEWDLNNFISHNDFKLNNLPNKLNKIAVITSNKAHSKGHRERLNFILKLKNEMKEKVDIFGNGFASVEDKYEILKKYKYALVIENCSYPNYWTEKLADAFLSNTYPIYYGCSNINKYFSKDALTIINIKNVESSIKKIQYILNNNLYTESFDAILSAKDLVLEKYNIFNVISEIVEKQSCQTQEGVLSYIYPQIGIKKKLKNLLKLVSFNKKQ